MIRNLQPQRIRQTQKAWSIALTSFVLFGAVCQSLAQPMAIASTLTERPITAQVNESTSSAQLPQRVDRRVRRDLAQRFNLAQRDLRVMNFSRETWSDSCLGLAAPNERCAMATVEGWRIEVTNGQQDWVYRTDLKARVIKLETSDGSELPPQAVDRLFEAIARQANVPANTLKVVASQARTWDGCMGIFAPGQACTKIAIAGYRVIVMGEQQSWVYHISQDGSRIVENETASGSGINITPSFASLETQTPLPTGDVVFQMTLSGGLRGDITETVLTSEGILYRRGTSMSASAISEPTIIKRLSSSELQQFQQILEQQKFPNLDGMRYLTSAALADYPTTVLQTTSSTVAYIDLEQDQLPQSLQAVIQAWDQLQ
ncbi:MAG: hypothetical protein HY785_17830 [Oscillatoriophycideae cyanobacterium NC_groundwater_1537_Pr4_S-0.65um_50_18]|nr:hypothetical protein [Oscillatoriophycideae cyanobacterium NC_groundwater_1537_Pr4_S-0.65um_50_18]